MRGRFLMLAGVLIGMPAAAQTVTKTEIRRQPVAKTDAELRDQLWGIFVPGDQRSDYAPRYVLDELPLVTRPYPTQTSGLCRRDTVILRFAPLGKLPVPMSMDLPADTPVRAYGISASQEYRAAGPVGNYFDEDEAWRDGGGARACATLGAGLSFFSAQSDYDAGEAIRALDLARRAVEAKLVAPDCSRTGVNSCTDAFARLIDDPPLWVGSCEAGESAGRRCWGVQMQFGRLLITYRETGLGGPESIESVRYSAISIIDDSGLKLD